MLVMGGATHLYAISKSLNYDSNNNLTLNSLTEVDRVSL